MGGSDALRVTFTARQTSFRSPSFAGVLLALPCPPPSTVRGMFAAAAGGQHLLPDPFTFAYTYTADDDPTNVDLEQYHRPLRNSNSRFDDKNVRDVPFHADATLTVWTPHVQLERNMRRPVWPVTLGRTQDVGTTHTRLVTLQKSDTGQQCAVVPEGFGAGRKHHLTVSISDSRTDVMWGTFHYQPGTEHVLQDVLVDDELELPVVPFATITR